MIDSLYAFVRIDGSYLWKPCKLEIVSALTTTPAVIDLFCGVGGLSHGFFKEGFNVLAGIDQDRSCKYPFETNNNARFINKSVEDVTPDEINKIFNDASLRILVGCAPCQPFSTYNRKKSKNDEWRLLRNFSELASKTRPDIISMENVLQVRHHYVFKEFLEVLAKANYTVSQYLVFCPDYGIPQRRKRLVLFASKFGKVKLLAKTNSPRNYRTLRNAIHKLRPIGAGEIDDSDPLHRSRKLSPLNLTRIRNTPEGGAWQSWDDSLKLECHKKEKGRSFRAVYGRMRWDEPASTLTTEFLNLGTGRFGHPEQDRTLSIREAAILQTFPRYYRFVSNKSEIRLTTLARHIGNAVPVRLSRIIAKSIKKHLAQVRVEE